MSGLRRPDGTLVASLVETRPPGPSRLRGPLATGSDGSFTIGRLRIAGLAPSLAGRRVSLVGRRVEDRFHATTVYIEPHVPFAAADRLLLEDYVARTPDGIRFGSGLDMVGNAAAALRAAMPMGESVRAVVTAKAGPEGRLGVESLRVARDGRGPGSHGGHRDPGLHGAGRPGATGDGVGGSAARCWSGLEPSGSRRPARGWPGRRETLTCRHGCSAGAPAGTTPVTHV